MQVFHTTAFEPAKDLFVRVLRLVLRRIPIKCVQHTPLRPGIATYGKEMMHESRHLPPEDGNSPQSPVKPIKARHSHPQNAV